MIIKDLHIDGFGVWKDLELESLEGGLTLLYGENETGKTTLLEFVRSVLYGYNEERRTKYLPPVGGGIGGGMLAVEAHAGKFRIRRRAEGDITAGRFDLTNLQGVTQDTRLLKKILADLDEATFKNVFALGLSEIQELSTLSGSGAAEYLYDLAVGSGGVSLTEVHRELENSRNRIFSSERNSAIGQLLDRRTALLADIEQLRQHGRGYSLLADERLRLSGDVERCEVEADEIRRNAHLLESAISVFERWHRREQVVDRLAELGEITAIPEEAWTKLAQLKERYRAERPLIQRLKKERADAKKQAFDLKVSKVLWQQGPRIEVLAAQENWIESLEQEISKLEAESATIPAAPSTTGRRETLSGEWVKLGLTPSAAEKLGDRKLLKSLRRAFRDVAAADKRLSTASDAEARQREIADAAEEEVETKHATPSRRESSSTLEDKSQLVTNLRRRVQVDQKIEQLEGHQEETKRQLRDKLEINSVPADAIFSPLPFLVISVTCLLTGLCSSYFNFEPHSIWPWVLVIVGLLGSVISGGAKVMRDLERNEEVGNLRRQSRSIEQQLNELTSERDQLDALIPAGGGPMLARLQTAEKELSILEERVAEKEVGETRRTVVRDGMEDVRVELRLAQDEADKAAKRLRQEFEKAGLPERMTWPQILSAAKQRARHDAVRRRRERKIKYLEQRRSELALVADRIGHLFTEAQLEPKGDRLVDHLRQLHAEWKRNEELLERRKYLQNVYRSSDKKLKAVRQELVTLKRRRRGLFKSLGVVGEKQLIRRRELLRTRDELSEEHGSIEREIAAALGNRGTDEELRMKIENYSLPQIEQRWTELCDRLAAVEKRLKELYEEQGRLQVRLEQIAADKSLPRKLYELKSVERQIGEALEKWETYTIAQRLLEMVRKKYELERQPETLREASRYFERLTEGRYKRVWTPLEAGVLFVDTAQGEKLSVEVLSRGTREQLFLSLRLALVDLYSRRGKVMPLVLDDVLVNFDTRRTRLAAELLCDFATDHRQVLLFTCHEHIYRLFKSLHADLRLLPGQTIDDDDTPVRVVEKIVEKVVKVKENVYVPTAMAAVPLPAMPRLDGLGVFHALPPRPAFVAPAPPPPAAPLPPPPPPAPVVRVEPEFEDVVEETIVEGPPQTIVRTERVGYPVVPMWSPATPFAEASWQDAVEEDAARPSTAVGIAPKNGDSRPQPSATDPREVQLPRRMRRGRSQFRVTDDSTSRSEAGEE
jgi:uncharacterized protein YhaN